MGPRAQGAPGFGAVRGRGTVSTIAAVAHGALASYDDGAMTGGGDSAAGGHGVPGSNAGATAQGVPGSTGSGSGGVVSHRVPGSGAGATESGTESHGFSISYAVFFLKNKK